MRGWDFSFRDTAASKGMNTIPPPTIYLSDKCFSHHLPEGKEHPQGAELCSKILGSHYEELWET